MPERLHIDKYGNAFAVTPDTPVIVLCNDGFNQAIIDKIFPTHPDRVMVFFCSFIRALRKPNRIVSLENVYSLKSLGKLTPRDEKDEIKDFENPTI